MATAHRLPIPPLAAKTLAVAGLGAGLGACEGLQQSALAPAGAGAERIADLFLVMAGGAALIWLGVTGLAVYAGYARPGAHRPRSARRLVLFGGVVFPTVVLSAMLVYGLWLMPQLLAPGDGPRIEVSGERWWWRIRYQLPDGTSVESANELRLPLGERAEFSLTSPDVIHSFWIPALGGKMDMVPGRSTRLALEPRRTGRFRGACAEYCGGAHAQMAFDVIVMEPAAWAEWLQAQARPAAARARGLPGQAAFLRHGCDACHRVRGIAEGAAVGPDLTHVGSRLSLGAGSIPNSEAALRDWISHPARIKPAVEMPSFAMLPQRDIADLAAWLSALQ